MDAATWETRIREADFPINGRLILDWSKELNEEADKVSWLVWPEKMEQILNQRRDWTAAARKAAQRKRERLAALKESWVYREKSPFPNSGGVDGTWAFAQALFGKELQVLEIGREEVTYDSIVAEKLELRAEASKSERVDFYERYKPGLPRLIGLLALLYACQEGLLGFQQDREAGKIWVTLQ